MSIEPEEFVVKISDNERVTALLYSALKKDRAGLTVLLGHGAGANQLSGFMRLFARGLADRGFDAATFNFLYTEQGRRSPDPKNRLESCYQKVIRAAQEHNKLKGNKLVIGGKSMGGRIASQVAAAWISLEATNRHKPGVSEDDTKNRADALDSIDGLVFLGYPLHPPGKPEQVRDKHLVDIRAPMLFVQGSRDAFGTAAEIREVIKRLRLPATLHSIEGGDHSLKVPKSASVSQGAIYDSTMDRIASWLVSECKSPL